MSDRISYRMKPRVWLFHHNRVRCSRLCLVPAEPALAHACRCSAPTAPPLARPVAPTPVRAPTRCARSRPAPIVLLFAHLHPPSEPHPAPWRESRSRPPAAARFLSPARSKGQARSVLLAPGGGDRKGQRRWREISVGEEEGGG